MHVGIMGAMTEEIALLGKVLGDCREEEHGMRCYRQGYYGNHQVTLVFSRWGKVAAASTATTLIDRYGVDALLFTGVAGAIAPSLQIGDIVIATELIQHDMDVSRLANIPRYQVPLLGLSHFPCDLHLAAQARRAAEDYLAQQLSRDVPDEVLQAFSLSAPRVYQGLIASGDQFIADSQRVQDLRQQLPDLLCVEMEGAAVAQVAYEHQLPCAVVRTISDHADHSAGIDFPRFVSQVASHFTCGSLLMLLQKMDL